MQPKPPQSNPASVKTAAIDKTDDKTVRHVDISHFDDLPDAAMISVKALATVVDKGVSTVWRNCQQDPDFPKPIRLGPGCTRFKVGDIRVYLAMKTGASIKPKRNQRLKGQVAA